jgi:hypothetical protein
VTYVDVDQSCPVTWFKLKPVMAVAAIGETAMLLEMPVCARMAQSMALLSWTVLPLSKAVASLDMPVAADKNNMKRTSW